MADKVTLGVWNKNQLQKINIENVDLEGKVKQLRSEAQKFLSNSSENIDLTFCGLILEDEHTLSSYGITSGTTIHILEKPSFEKAPAEKKMTPEQLVLAFRSLIPGQRNAVQRLIRKEVLDKIIAANPRLVDEPAAMALVQDPELIVHLSNATEGLKIVEQYPILLEVAGSIIALLREEQANATVNQPSTSTGYSYSLQALSDDDDDDEMDSSSDSNMSQHPITRNSSFNAITAAQLAAAIANATNTQFNSGSAGNPETTSGIPGTTSGIPGTTSGIPSAGGSNLITSEMFSNAIQQAFAGASTAATPPAAAGGAEEGSVEALSRLWQVQLQQMHEMGLVDDARNIQALKMTNGDVNAAIEFMMM